jgi:hypothetical protein
MNIQDAAHRIGHEYPGGSAALAHRMGIGPVVFNSKLNPNTLTHHLTLAEAQRMQLLTGRTDILEAMADELGYVIVKIPECGHDLDIAKATRRAVVEFGQWMQEIDKSLEDGAVSRNELKAIEKELVEMMAQAQQLTAALASVKTIKQR